MTLVVERVRAIEDLRDEWELLDQKTLPRLPFTGPLWNAVWWKHFKEDRRLVRDTLQLFAIRDSQRVLKGVAPMMLTERPAVGPLRARMLQFLGADPNVTEVRGIVCAPEDEAAVTDALLGFLEAKGREWDWLFMGGVRQASDAFRLVGQRVHVEWGREVPDYLLAMPADWETFKAGLGRNIKESLRKCYNSLKRDNLQFRFNVLSAVDQMDAGLDHFLRLHAARAQVTDTISHRDVFESGHAREFLRDYLRLSAARDEARIFQLELAGKVVATRLAFVVGGALYLYFSGFDPDWGKYSVMTTTVAEALKWAIENRFATVNLSPGNDVSKTRWNPIEVMTREAIIPSPSFLGPVVRETYLRLEALRRDEKSGLARILAFARRRG